MDLFRHDLAIPLDHLVADAARAVADWDWSRGAYGHALSLPRRAELHPFGRYAYQNFPCTGLLHECPCFRQVFDSLRCEKVSFRLLRREPASAYAWHTDQWKGPGVVRFQIPIVSDARAFLVTTDYEHESRVQGVGRVLTEDDFPRFAEGNAGHFKRHHLQPGLLHYFNTTKVHTLVNPGPGERLTLSFDLVANAWLRDRFPEIEAELRQGPSGEPPIPGAFARAVGWARSRTFPVRTMARRWRAGHQPAGSRS